MRKYTCAVGASLVLLFWNEPATAAKIENHPHHPSDGCGRPAPETAPTTVAVGKRTRALIITVPKSYQPDHPHTLVVAFHGRTNSNAEVRGYFDLERNASEPTIFVYPAGLPDASGRNTWSDPGDPPSGLRDFKLFDAILAMIMHAYCIDRDRVFVVGHSLGAWFANNLACARGDVIRGLASVGGGSTRPKDCGGPVAAMVLHNPSDAHVPIAQGLQVRNALLEQNHLSAVSKPDHLNRFECSRYGPKTAENPVLWCPYADNFTANGRFYPHQWPAGSGAAVMEFFAALQ
ncbi:MAG TPA: hypothetical protein VD978_16170 [Azospirillum sp.]|nr:hypothetical protein [Azospirillum sp.]